MLGHPVNGQSPYPRRIAAGPLLIALGLCLALLSGCRIANGQDPETQRSKAAVVTLTRVDDGKAIEVQPGDTIIVRLDENATTGFQWAVDKSGDDILTLQNSDYAPAPGSKIGGGGQRIFTFRAQKAGAVGLQLKLWRQWEGDKSVIERFAVAIEVRG